MVRITVAGAFLEGKMTDIFIVGSRGNDRIGRLIKNRLSETYEVTYFCGNSVERYGAGYKLLVFDCESPFFYGISGGIALFKNGKVNCADLPENCTAIINADDPTHRKILGSCDIPAVACGLSPTATISFTSETDDTLVVSLNRELVALSGKTIEPLEIPVKKGGSDNYTLMSFTALRLLLDDFDSELGKLI